jgi:hypothetical protein
MCPLQFAFAGNLDAARGRTLLTIFLGRTAKGIAIAGAEAS